jgi:hypothetical protein
LEPFYALVAVAQLPSLLNADADADGLVGPAMYPAHMAFSDRISVKANRRSNTQWPNMAKLQN